MNGARRNGRFILIAALALIGGWTIMTVLAADKKADKGAPKTPPASVKVATVAQRTIAPDLVAVGNVIPYQTVSLTARLDSQITDIKFKAGDMVVKDQVLFILDARELQAALSQAKAKLAGDIAQLDNLEKDYQRQELGVQQQFSSRAQRDAAKAALEGQKAQIQIDRAAIQRLNVQIGYTTITAPIDGRTGTINFTLGNTVRANDAVPLVTINQIKPISVEAALPQNSIDAIRAAQGQGPVPVVAVTSTGRRVEGQLEYINNTIDPANGTFTTRSTFANDDELLWPGTMANLTVTVGTAIAVTTIPEVAVQESQSGDFVYVVTDGKAEKRPVTLTRIQDGLALIAQGLKTGEQVAVDGIMSVKDGGAVAINTDADPATVKPAAGPQP